MVYPGAVHTRFEHSLGVYWLAGKSIDIIKKYQVNIYMFIFKLSYVDAAYEIMLLINVAILLGPRA